MHILFTAFVLAFVLGVLALVVLTLFEVSPFGHHSDHYRDPRTGKRCTRPPNLEDRQY